MNFSSIAPVCPICRSPQVEEKFKVYDDRYGYPGTYPLYSCKSCNHIFLNAHFSEEQLRNLYTNFYPRSSYRLEDVRPLSFEPGLKSWWNGEKRAFAIVPPNVDVLDIGCGIGESLLYHQQRGSRPVGVETDENIKRVAEKHQLKVHVGVFREGLFPLQSFDFVTMDQVIEHSTDPLKLLRDIKQVLRPGGKLVLTFPNAFGIGARKYGQKWLHWHAPYHLHFFSKKSFEILIQKAGFNLEEFSTHTNSAWLFYQQVHLNYFPEKQEKPSYFWAREQSKVKPTEAQEFVDHRINKKNKLRIYHLQTRIFDGIGMGDNILTILRSGQ